MKTRNGFVSNSSSSSFIISNEKFKTVRSLAKYMIKKKIEENSYYKEDDDSDFINFDKLYIKRLMDIDKNQTVSFPSCNYDTYIRKVGDQYLVATCNNTDWDLYEYCTNLSESAIEELEELKTKYPKGSDDISNIEYILEGGQSEFSAFGKDFYALDSEIIGIETYDYCPNPDTEDHRYVRMWDTAKFGKICLKCNPIFKRKDKLDAINKFAENE